MAIDLKFSEEQEMIRDSARQFFAAEAPPAVVRRHQNSADEYPADVWRRMAELGWLGMPFAEDFGGIEAGYLDMYPLYLELGRSLAPVPHLETVVLAGGLVAALGDAGQKAEILTAIAEGRSIVTPAILEPGGGYGPQGVRLAARAAGGGHVLSGVKLLAAYAGAASRLVVAARTGGSGADGVSLFLVDPKGPGVGLERTPNTSGLPLYAVTFSDAPGELLGPLGGGWPALDEAMVKAGVLQAAMVAGAGERILDMTIDYAKTRHQFGEPIGKHQAVQYLVTDVAIHGHNTGLLALQAAWRIDAGRPFRREAAFAGAAASRAAAVMTHAAHEVHAGIAFMLDYDLQLYTRRAKHWEFNLGDYRHHLERAASSRQRNA
jgi:alkylation response protein AidB-like acyl-CoA dehydrogenase